MVAACIVKPGKNWVLPLRPEFVEPQKGYDKQDCESRALRRWLESNAARYSRLDPVYPGDDIYSKQRAGVGNMGLSSVRGSSDGAKSASSMTTLVVRARASVAPGLRSSWRRFARVGSVW
jgi:hypothetical protein